MSLGKLASLLAIVALTLPFQSCGGSSSSEADNVISSALQDLGADPTGATTVLMFGSTKGLAGATTANFASDDGQMPTSVLVAGAMVTVEWDAYVSPSSQVRAIGLSDVSSAWRAVTTSDSSAPTYTIANGTQTAPLGGDSFDVEFAGTYVVESEVETLANWRLTVNGTDLVLTGSTIVFDDVTQTATFTLGTLANLHADFSLHATGVHAVSDAVVSAAQVDGAATGDTTAPTLVSATQNLTEDEFGRVVEFLFDEPMDPVFSIQLSHFGVLSPAIAVEVTRPTDNTLRVAFNNPMVPGVDTVDLTSLVDAHGNAFTDVTQAISQPAPVVNAYDTLAATTVANAGGDTITVTTTQALDPRTADDPAAWTLDVAGNPVVLTAQTLEYDLAAKTLTITLAFDMNNGDAFTVTGVTVLDVDGQAFTLASGGSASGDATAPTVTSVTQNRNLDATGKTLIVQFSEDVDETTAETLGNYAVSGTQVLTTATLLAGGDAVQLAFNALVVPGDTTFDAANVQDLAGNAMAAAVGLAIGTSDATAPHPGSFAARAIEGANNDTVSVQFDDDMIESEVEAVASWTVESPVGNALSTVGATAVYDVPSRIATLTFANGVNFHRGDDASVTFTACRDIAGNTVATTVLSGNVDAETTLPTVHTIYRWSGAADAAVIVFSEPCGQLDNLYEAILNPAGTRYVLRTSGGVQRGLATACTVLSDGLAARVSFGIVIAASDTIDVIGVSDLCGNPLFPAFAVPTVAEDTSVPALLTGSSAVAPVSGENNDVITVVFDRPMSPWTLLDPAHYTITGTGPVDLSQAVLTFDGTDTVTIVLRNSTGNNLQAGDAYTVVVDGVWSAQGVQRSVPDVEAGIPAMDDATAPAVPVGRVRLDPTNPNALLIEADEALDHAAAQTAANYDYDGGNIAVSATRLGQRTVRAVFAVVPAIGQNLQFTVTDLAGNVSGTITRAVAAADAAGPLVSSVAGVVTPGWGRDIVTISFDEPVTGGTALVASNYAVTSGSRTLSMTNARLSYSSIDNTVTILFAAGQELDGTASVSVTVGSIKDHSNNAMPATIVVGGAVTGDTTAPAISAAFVNLYEDLSGLVVDVLFSEDVDAAWAANAANWTASGGQTIGSVTLLERNHARLVLGTALSAAHTLSIGSVPDLANNVSNVLTVDPTE